MYRDVAGYGLLEGAALWLARATFNPSRLVACIIEPLQKLRVRLGSCQTGLSPQ